ncbi:unnamed protein product [Dovyalis caffra]|uniref:Uncharacterized protein n=1 Tax=Dovyalis caffra TaxID=77055 RepID=A0AAV1SRE3_9ROSI|nr:unnamed protein product [Dovyalis caffra]
MAADFRNSSVAAAESSEQILSSEEDRNTEMSNTIGLGGLCKKRQVQELIYADQIDIVCMLGTKLSPRSVDELLDDTGRKSLLQIFTFLVIRSVSLGEEGGHGLKENTMQYKDSGCSRLLVLTGIKRGGWPWSQREHNAVQGFRLSQITSSDRH